MGEIFEKVAPVRSLAWTGERLTSETGGQVEIEHLHRYFFARSLCRGLDVLDIASGEGYGAALLAQVARQVVGVEISAEAVAHAQAAYHRPNLRYQQGDARRIPLPDASVDVVVSFETIEHFDEHEIFMKEVGRVLRPDGYLIISSPERDNYSPAGAAPNPHHVRELTRNEFDDILRRSFKHVTLYAQRALLGAALIPETGTAEATPFLTFERRSEVLFEGSSGLPRAPYLVAVASHVARPACQGSLYVETSGVEGIFSSALAARQQMAALSGRVAEGEEHARQIQSALDQAGAEIAQLQSQLQLARSQAAGYERELGACFQLLQAEKEAHSLGIRKVQDEGARRVRQLAEAISRTDAEIAQLARVLDEEREAHERTRAALAESDARVQAIWGSASWRITAPMRFVLRRVPGLHRALTLPRRAARRLLRPQPPEAGRAHPSAAGAAANPAAPAGDWGRDSGGRPVAFRLEYLPGTRDVADALPRQPGKEKMICFTHVVPFPRTAGNEYRIHNMLKYLADSGRDILLVLCPLAGEAIDQESARLLASVYPGMIICGRDGLLRHNLEDGEVVLGQLAGRIVRDAEALLRGASQSTPLPAKLADLQRSFCPDVLVELLLHLDGAIRPSVVLAEYIFMNRALPLLGTDAVKIVDTLDAFSSKSELVERFGVSDGLSLTDEEEASLLSQADIAIAIQEREADIFRKIGARCDIVTVGVDFAVRDTVPAVTEPSLLLVGSGNAMNVQGLRDFLQLCWPLVRDALPEAQLRIVGSVGAQVGYAPPGVQVLGRVDDLGAEYDRARVIINPIVAGTGLKIKTVEALSHLRPVVCWPAGADGLGGVALEQCHVVGDWSAFARQVVQILQDDGLASAPLNAQAELRAYFDAKVVYAPLLEALERQS